MFKSTLVVAMALVSTEAIDIRLETTTSASSLSELLSSDLNGIGLAQVAGVYLPICRCLRNYLLDDCV